MEYKESHSVSTHRSNSSDGSEFYSIHEEKSKIAKPEESQADLGSLHSPQTGQPSPAVIDPEGENTPGGNHYEMGCNGNYNSGPGAVARYPRMEHEIGGKTPHDYGNDRINLEHDSMLIHRR